MAKSQYTDNITGNVILDTRIVNNKIINLQYKNNYTTGNFGYGEIATDGKFSTKSIKIINKKGVTSSDVYFSFYINHSISNIYTVSWWQKTISNITSASSSSANYKAPIIMIYSVDTSGNTKALRSIEPWWLNSSKSRACIQSFDSSGNWNYNATSTTAEVSTILNSWIHYAIIVNGVNIYLYRNGTLILSNNKVQQQHSSAYKKIYIQFGITYGSGVTASVDASI